MFRRGDGIARAQGVLEHRRTQTGAAGRVVGSDGAYRVEVTLGAEGVGGDCECIARLTMPVCKHMVALVLVAFAEAPPPGPSLDTTIAALPRETLVELLGDVARRDPAVHTRVEAIAAARAGDLDLRAVQRAITQATTPPRDPSWSAAARVAERAEDALGLVRGIVDARAAGAPKLVEHLIGRVDRLLSRVDDSGGSLGAVRQEVRDLHLAACIAVPPPPPELAGALVRIACATDWDWVHDAPERYRDVLGASGLSALDRAIATARAAQSPPVEAASGWVHESHAAFTLRLMAESAARASGDPDRVVRVLAEDLRSAGRYVQIADALQAAGREREALAWLERGRAAHGPGDDRLRAALSRAFRRDGAIEDALALARDHLMLRPTARAFRELREVSGDHEWPAQREWALQTIARASADEHVLALIADRVVADALAVADQTEILPATRRSLARAAARIDIDRALSHYALLLESSLEPTGRSAYRDAIGILREMHDAAAAYDRADEVIRAAQGLRDAFRRRPALVEMLDDLGWW